MATLAVQITDAGASGPDYSDILQQLKNLYWSLYGSDAILDADSQDGQFLAALAQIVFDSNQSVINAYAGFAPNTARGAQLSRLVKINGLRRAVPTNSQVDVTIVGVIGSQIINGVVGDDQNLGSRWDLPTLVVIPDAGEITVTATSQVSGDVVAGVGTITRILTPTLGWQTVTNDVAATPGEPVETDAQLRVRQTVSVSLPAMTILEGIQAAIEAVSGVQRVKAYENDEDVPDADGLPAHSFAFVVFGGDVTTIAEAIALKKAPGIRSDGTIATVIIDQNGVPNTIRFYPLTVVPLKTQITIHPLPGFVSTTGDMLKQTVVDFINSYDIGEDSYTSRLYSPANLTGDGLGATYVVTDIKQAKVPDALSAADVAMLFNEGASIDLAHVTLVIV